MIPGEMWIQPGELELNAGRKTVRLTVANRGDRPIQVGSHYHFFETNEALDFDRATARGFRLNIAAGTAVRFEPGQERDVELVALDGDRIVYGFNAKVMGSLEKGKAGVSRKQKAGESRNEKTSANQPLVGKSAAPQSAARKLSVPAPATRALKKAAKKGSRK